MSWLDQLAEHVEELRRAGHLQQNGRSAEALPILDDVLAVATDPTTRAYALVQRFGALINLGRVAELATAMAAAASAVREIPDPFLRGQMHAFAALGAYLQRNVDRGVTHLVQASRALGCIASLLLGCPTAAPTAAPAAPAARL